MARGRHRHSALHRVWIPVALGGAALACAGTAWLVGGPGGGDVDALREAEIQLLRVLPAGAAVAAVVGAVLLRRWDIAAGRLVARERATKASLTARVEQRQAELEEARERVTALEEKVQAKRGELARLRTEHAALLRRYATAETERANALEGRRLLALEAAEPAKALPAQAADHRTSGGAPTALTYLQAYEALGRLSRSVARQREAAEEAARAERAERERLSPASGAAPAPTPQGPGYGEAPGYGGPPVIPPPRRDGGFDFFHRDARSENAPAENARGRSAP
ncbi:coiled-coil domain-containing protein [Streptomyces sp. 4N509B]|uniref:coiled-coil domain-containing protein n=1 Tax=Streptomyces sp. 4N509B TaxID=3457413 RepID=UPI003FD6B04B